ncbi:hypothetical protein SLA2020_119500 [Shorea laevis]
MSVPNVLPGALGSQSESSAIHRFCCDGSPMDGGDFSFFLVVMEPTNYRHVCVRRRYLLDCCCWGDGPEMASFLTFFGSGKESWRHVCGLLFRD